MARGINKVIIVGTLGADPETRYTAAGSAITGMRLATNESWTDKQTGEKKERTEWHSVTLFGRLGEVAAEYLSKGRQVYIEGSLRTEEYEKDGTKRYATKIIANEMQLLGGGDGKQRERSEPRQGRQQAAPSGPPADEFDSDSIPF